VSAWLLRRVLLTGAIAGLLGLAGLAVTDGSRPRSALVAAEMAKGTSASTLRLSPQAQLDAALNAALSRLGGRLHAQPRAFVLPPGALPPSAQGFACPVASSGSCSASPCRRLIGSASVSPVAPVEAADRTYQINALGKARSLTHQAGSSTCSSSAPARALPISSPR
jgi:hypothetical protein